MFRQSPPTSAQTQQARDTDGTRAALAGAFRRGVAPVPGCTACATASIGGPAACVAHALEVAVADAAQVAELREQLADVLSVVRALAESLGERKAVPGQVLAGLDIQVHALAKGGAR